MQVLFDAHDGRTLFGCSGAAVAQIVVSSTDAPMMLCLE